MSETDYEEQLKAASAEVYEHAREIAAKNKILALLAKLYDISIETLAPKELTEQIVKAVQVEFDFERVGVLLYEATSDALSSLAFAESERFHTARGAAADFFDTFQIAKATENPFFSKILKDQTMTHTERLSDVWGSSISAEVLTKIQSDSHVKSLLAYPLFIGNKVIGVFMLTLNRSVDELVEYEKQSIANIVNITAVALDKALIYEELQRTNERQETLIHFIGHEVKGFLTKDEGAFAALRDGDFGQLPETLKPFVEHALTESRQGADSVANILKASNLKKGTVAYTKAPFDLKALVAEAVARAKPMVDAKGLQLSFTADDAVYQMTGDKAQINDHVLRNLIENAINYTPTGMVQVSLKNENGKLIFAVKDSGIGITDEDKKRLFTEGGHGKDSIKVNVHSTGYGLYIAKSIVEAHGGTIRGDSEGAGKGSTFTVEFPV